MPTTIAEGYPAHYEGWLTLKNGREIFLRPILQADEPLILELFHKLSPRSLSLRFLRHLHTLPGDMLYHFTHVDYHNQFALIAVAKEEGKEAIIAVGRYAHDPHEEVTDLAVAVRDDWQQVGLGKAVLAKIIAIGKEHGISRFESVMDPQNTLIRHILLELGYEVKYSLRSGVFHVEIVI